MKTLKEQMRWKATKEDGEWLIRGKRGVISMYNTGKLNVWVTNPRIANKITWKPLHTYDDGADYIRKIDDIDIACRYIKARKRRQLSPETLEKLRARLTTMRSSARKPYVDSGLIS